ncbi:NAD-dependent epimerase/dehydratase family protein, partial [Actinomadura adrarensis]
MEVPPLKILVAGATGVVGRRLVPLLVRAGHEVAGTTRRAERAQALT